MLSATADKRKRDALRKALLTLPRLEHLAILLTYDHDMTTAEVAAVLEKPVSEATTIILRARRKLREAMIAAK